MHIQYILCVFVLLDCEFDAVCEACPQCCALLASWDGWFWSTARLLHLSTAHTHTHAHTLIVTRDHAGSLHQSVHVCMRVNGQRVGVLLCYFFKMFCVHVCPPAPCRFASTVCLFCSHAFSGGWCLSTPTNDNTFSFLKIPSLFGWANIWAFALLWSVRWMKMLRKYTPKLWPKLKKNHLFVCLCVRHCSFFPPS